MVLVLWVWSSLTSFLIVCDWFFFRASRYLIFVWFTGENNKTDIFFLSYLCCLFELSILNKILYLNTSKFFIFHNDEFYSRVESDIAWYYTVNAENLWDFYPKYTIFGKVKNMHPTNKSVWLVKMCSLDWKPIIVLMDIIKCINHWKTGIQDEKYFFQKSKYDNIAQNSWFTINFF